ncbi:hypothetical protein TNCV_5092011 [Trichonephila clavipes]|nr:hypothetical protein TNCV_5092011 [Trichonephila clavipes]
MRAVGYRPRNFEPQSSDEDNTRDSTPNLDTTPTGEDFEPQQLSKSIIRSTFVETLESTTTATSLREKKEGKGRRPERERTDGGKSRERTEERGDGRESGKERERSPPCIEKRAESWIGEEKDEERRWR